MDASRADAKSNYARAMVLLATGVLPGIAIWLFSPQLTGKVEPWDADAPIWPLSWLLIAALGGLVGHLRGICLPLGYALVRYKQADALELPFADGTFDVV